jgi:hypothetical protein
MKTSPYWEWAGECCGLTTQTNSIGRRLYSLDVSAFGLSYLLRLLSVDNDAAGLASNNTADCPSLRSSSIYS